MKAIKYTHLPLTLLLYFFSCSAFSIAIIDTNSMYYEFEGGAEFKDGQVNTQTSSGGLFYAIGEDGAFNWIGKGEQKDQYNDTYGGYGFTNVRLTTSDFTQLSGQYDYGYNNSTTALNFITTFIEWDFTALEDDALLYATILPGTGSAHFNIFNITSGVDLFDSGNLNAWQDIDNFSVLLEQDNSYRISSLINNSSPGYDGYESYTTLVFENASIKVPAPSSFLFLGFGLIALLKPKKYKTLNKVVDFKYLIFR